jgi:hypothetical protein
MTAAWAQIGTASLKGQVTDPSGAVIPGATVTQQVRAESQSGYHKSAGSLHLIALPPGQYTVRVLAKGFAVFESKVDLATSAAQTLNAALVVSVDTQEVTVSDQLHVDVDPSNNASQLVLKGADLDVLSDNPDDLASDLQALAGPSVGPNGGQIYIDGFTGGRLPPKESIREIRINQNPFSAEYDRLGYGRIEVFTKPGTDRFRGTVFFNFGDDIFNSRNPFAATKAPYQQRYWGGNVSGPISKKSSFFIDFDRRSIDDNAAPSQRLESQSRAIQRDGVDSQRFYSQPRMDYQLSPSNTLVLRYTYTDTNAKAGVGQFTLPSRAFNTETVEQS